MNLKTEISMSLVVVMLAAVVSGIPGVRGDWPSVFEQFGPHVDELLISLYQDKDAEFAALEAGEIDLVDSPADVTYPNTETMDYGGELGFYEFDINNNLTKPDAVPGGSDPNVVQDNIGRFQAFRHAVAHMVNRFIPVGGIVTPIHTSVPPALGAWRNLNVDQHPFSLTEAVAILDAADITDKNGDGYRDWPASVYPSPFMRVVIDFVLRTDDQYSVAIGSNVIQMLTADLPGAKFQVDVWMAGSDFVAEQWVMRGKSFTIYTGHKNANRDPYYLYSLYHSSMYWQQGAPPNYNNVSDAELDGYLEGIYQAQSYAEAMTNTQAAQAVMADRTFVVPVYASSNPKAARTRYTGGTNETLADPDDGENQYRGKNWNGFANEYGRGLNSWWSILGAHVESAPGVPMEGGVLRYGFRVPEVSSLNPLYGYGYWDWEVMGKVYDTLLRANPYDLSEDLEWVARRWSAYLWLRDDVYWHDGQRLDADDIRFTFMELDDLLQAGGYDRPWFFPNVQYISNVRVISQFFVQVLFSRPSIFWRHMIGEIPILPEHIWRSIVTSGDPETFAPDPQLIGAGPYKAYPHSVDKNAGDYYVPTQYVKLDAYKPSSPGYFNNGPIRVSKAVHGSTIDVYLQNFAKTAITLTALSCTAGSTPLTPTTPGPYVVPARPGMGNVAGVLVVKFSGLSPPNAMYTMTVNVQYFYGEAFNQNWEPQAMLAPSVDGDTNNDGAINVIDAILLSTNFGLKAYIWPECDVNADKTINIIDAIIITNNFGQTAP